MLTRFISVAILFISISIYPSTVGAGESKQVIGPAVDQLIPLLKKHKFTEISEKLAALHQEYERDPKIENEFHKAAYEFYRADPEIGKLLDIWITQSDKVAFTHLARGLYRVKMGWSSRGAKWAQETSTGQFRDMAAWFDLAKSDLNIAIKIQPKLVEAYCYLIEIDMTEGGSKIQTLYEKALKINPASFIAREFFLHSLLPRWGGSYKEMATVIGASKSYYSQMPQLATLEGRIDADIGELLMYRRDFQQAQGYLSQALSKGDFWYSVQKYGELLYEIDNYTGAVEQFTKVIAYKPGYKRAWWMRAQSYKMMRRFPEAIADINRAIEIEPKDEGPIAARGYIYKNSGQLNLALQDFETVAAINPAEQSYKEAIATVHQMLKSSK